MNANEKQVHHRGTEGTEKSLSLAKALRSKKTKCFLYVLGVLARNLLFFSWRSFATFAVILLVSVFSVPSVPLW